MYPVELLGPNSETIFFIAKNIPNGLDFRGARDCLDSRIHKCGRHNKTKAPTYRLTFSKAHSDVALESNIVAAGELEGVESGQQTLSVGIVLPLAKDGRIRGTAVLIGDQILILDGIFHCFGHTASGKASID